MNIDARLKAIANLIEGKTVADIGCDHGKLCAYILKENIAEKIYGIDISADSIKKCERLKKKENLNNFEIMLGDGLDQIKTKDVDSIIMAGMGGNMIANIIANNMEYAKKAKRIIMQPMRDCPKLRLFLYENGFEIIDEEMVFHNSRYYNIIVAKNGNNLFQLSDVLVGKKLIEKKHPLLNPWLKRNIKRLKSDINKFEKNAKDDAPIIKLNRLKERYNVLVEVHKDVFDERN